MGSLLHIPPAVTPSAHLAVPCLHFEVFSGVSGSVSSSQAFIWQRRGAGKLGRSGQGEKRSKRACGRYVWFSVGEQAGCASPLVAERFFDRWQWKARVDLASFHPCRLRPTQRTRYEVLNWNNIGPARTLLSNLQNKTDVVSPKRRFFFFISGTEFVSQRCSSLHCAVLSNPAPTLCTPSPSNIFFFFLQGLQALQCEGLFEVLAH